MIFDLQDRDSVGVMQGFLANTRAKGKTVGLTSGCFDLIHFHHFGFFLRCRRHCDYLVVGVDSDELVRSLKGTSRPIIPDFRRAIMVDALKPVSFAFIMNGLADFGRAAEMCKPDVIFKNEAFKGKETDIVGREHAKRIMIIDDQLDHSSTTDIISSLRRRRARRA
ncbi:MAG: adenylyltransferase/cytidyltransferase family protein [Patescibacteria group bacterium]|nr:adenylyltransferase/cytidyltransferase family protein [Patescibacteria group bacterium]MDE2116510.1 adenylyltransferase/cytidyltransferase family protein [Patescibacteria group bacterium]